MTLSLHGRTMPIFPALVVGDVVGYCGAVANIVWRVDPCECFAWPTSLIVGLCHLDAL